MSNFDRVDMESDDELSSLGDVSDFDCMDMESSHESSSSEENECEDEPNSSDEDEFSDEPSSSDEDDSEYEPYRPAKRRKEMQLPQASVALQRRHLGAFTNLEVGTVISKGDAVELHDSSFLRITELRTPKNGCSVEFDGDLFRPIEEFKDYLPMKFGDSELVWLCEARENDPRPQGYRRTAGSKDIVRIRDRILTSSDPAFESSPQLEATGMSTDKKPLFCRWKLVAELSNSTEGRARSFRSVKKGSIMLPKAFIALSSEELSVGPPAQSTESEGSSEPKTYTFSDVCCGAGGMSQGAKAAGLQISWAFDSWEDAVDSYCANHGQGVAFQLAAEDFELEASKKPEGHFKSHILHCSPDCKELSQANKGPQRDTVNTKRCLTYVGRIVKIVRPRIVTFEEVPNLIKMPKYRDYFTSMVRDLTSLGYSVRWRVIQCADFGVPQKRIRLFLIASGPGDSLPDFPARTHAHKSQYRELGLQKWSSFGEAIDNLEENAPNHLLAYPRQVRDEPNWDIGHPQDWPLNRTMTSGENWPDHYSGMFRCTLREGASLQGFPPDYEFRGPLDAIIKQIVNGVPPIYAKVLLETIMRHLMQTDALRRS